MAKGGRVFGQFTLMLRMAVVAAGIAFLAGLLVVVLYAGTPSRILDLAKRPTLVVTDGRTFPPDLPYAYPLYVEIDKLPDYVVPLLEASEDRRFRDHFGVDFVGIARALFNNARGGALQGGSTITQQLVKRLLLSSEQTYGRKILEVVLAVYLDLALGKDRIAEMYLNQAYFGDDAYGIEAASRRFFRSRASDLSPLEAAMLVSSVKKPSAVNVANRRVLLERRAMNLLRRAERLGLISARVIRSAKVKPPAKARIWNPRRRHYARDQAIDELRKRPEVKGVADFTIYLTLDPELQLYADLAVDRALRQSRKYGFDQIALVAMELDGRIRALVGGWDYERAVWNRATLARRQPGSAFKPVVFLAAFEDGRTPETVVRDEPVVIDGYAPRNIDRKFLGRMTAGDALVLSRNVATVRLSETVGRKRVIAMARALGLEGDLPDDPTLALGSGVHTLLDLTEAFAAIANGGKRVESTLIDAIRRNGGGMLYLGSPAPSADVASPAAICALGRLLDRVIGPGGTGARANFGDVPAAGKTGTSQDYRDALFLGFTGHLVTGVWIGRDDNGPMRALQGGDLPARVWADFMRNAHLGRERLPLQSCTQVGSGDG